MRLNPDEIRKIKEDVKKSGFPLEVEVHEILRKFDWRALHQQPFFDKEEGKQRPIDIVAIHADHSPLGDYTLFHMSLIIECKSSVKHPWIFYTVPKEKELFSFPFSPVEHYALPRGYKKKKMLDELQKWMPFSHIYRKNLNGDRVALHYYEAFKKGKGIQIYKARNQVIKSLTYQLEKNKELTLKYRKVNPNYFPLFISYPVIVFDGHLLELKSIKDDPIPANHLQYLTSTTLGPIIIDVIKKEHLPRFLDELNHEIREMKESLKKG